MAYFIKTDSDESLLAAMEIAADMEAGGQSVHTDELVQITQHRVNEAEEVLARLDRGLPQSTRDVSDHVAENVQLSPMNATLLNMTDRCNVFTSMNQFNSGIDFSGDRVQAMQEISRQGLATSTLLFAALGHPAESEI
jgi:hypothetical protein